MSERNLCAVLHGVSDLRLEERPIPIPAKDEVQINIRSVGLCGSDAALYRTAYIGHFPLKHPILLGHEPCGVVSKVGSEVKHLAVGDRVVLSPHYGCGTCQLCQGSRYNLCTQAHMMATPPTNGALANYITWPARLCFKMPPGMTWDEGAYVQPIALALYGCERAGVKPGHRVLVCGAGPLGIVMVMAAKAFGASRICVTDIVEDRLQFLSEVSGCSAVRSDEGTSREVAARVTTLLGQDADVALECSGAPSAVGTAIYATKLAGCIVLCGIGPEEVQIPLRAAATKELDIRSMFRFTDTYPAAIDLIASGKIDVKPYITHKFQLADVVEAFKKMNQKARGKVIVQCSED